MQTGCRRTDNIAGGFRVEKGIPEAELSAVAASEFRIYRTFASMDFKLVSEYKPTGDQPEAIAQLVDSIRRGSKHNTLRGVTGSGKTFTAANVIAQINKPTLV